MPTLTTWMLATAISLMPMLGAQGPRRIDVDCTAELALERALARAEKLADVEIHLQGVCRGHFVIAADGVTLRGATPESGLAAPPGATGSLPVLEIVDAHAILRDLLVEGGEVGVLARGWDAELLLVAVDVHDQQAVGVVASRGAQVRLFGTTVRDGFIGVLAQHAGNLNLQDVVLTGQRVGVIVSESSFAALSDATIENNLEAGLHVDERSDANVVGGVFRENGQVHVSATDWSSVTLLRDVGVGLETDATPLALAVNRNATIASFTTAVLYGDVSALVGGSIRLGNTVLDGNLIVVQFADAHVRNAEIRGSVLCVDGADAICRQTTTGGAFDCPSSTCGSPTSAAIDRASSLPDLPVIEVPRFERPPRSPSRP